MSNDIQKADQIAHRCYSKLALLVHDARLGSGTRSPAKPDRWFNLESPDTDVYKEQLRVYRSISTANVTPPFELDVLLAVPDLLPNQVLVYSPPESSASRIRVEPTPSHVLLESWSITFSRQDQQHTSGVDLAPSSIYKHGIGLFRAIYTLLRVAPTWKVYKRLQRNASLSIQLRVRSPRDQTQTRGAVLEFGTPLAANGRPLQTATHTFPPVPHPSGMLSLAVTYLTAPQHFAVDDLESLLSSRFFSLDEGADFTPTLIKNQQRDSLSSSPSSLALRTSLPASPPLPVRQPATGYYHSRTTSFPALSSSPSTRQVGLPTSRPSEMGSAISVGSSRRGSTSREDIYALPLPSAAARLRKESTGSVRGSADLPSSPGPLPIRRPQLNTLNPFKSSTLSSGSPSLPSPSPSLRQASPLGGPGLPARPHASPTSSRMPPSPIGSGALASRPPSSPVASYRPSPPFQPGSLDRRSATSAEGSPANPKRYSSSFGHRYKDSLGAASEGSAGGDKPLSTGAMSRAGGGNSPSYMGANADEEDLSAFVSDTSQAKPLNRHYRAQTIDPHVERIRSASASPLPSPPSRPRPLPTSPTSTENEPQQNVLGLTVGPLLTSQAQVDEELVRMSEKFNESLRGLGSRRRERTLSSPGSGGGAFARRADRISEVTEESASTSVRSDASRTTRPRPGSCTDSVGSEEVIGKLELDDPQGTRRRPR